MASLLVASATRAQTVYPASIPGLGDYTWYKLIQDTTINPNTQTGLPPVTWDFTSYFIYPNTFTRDFLAPSATPYGSHFPGSNLATSFPFGGYEYYTVTGSQINYLGYETPTARITLNTGQKVLYTPFNYGNAINNTTVTGTSSGLFGGAPISGSITVNSDAWGTLNLSTGGFPNTTRIVTDFNLVADLGPGLEINFRLKKYQWYITGKLGPLMEVYILDITGPSISPVHQKYSGVSYKTSGVEEFAKPSISLSVIPNPVSAEASVSVGISRLAEVNLKISDLTGRIWKEISYRQQPGISWQKFDVADLPRGIYILTAESETAVQEQRILVQ